MRIIDAFSTGKPVFSFEFFPPRTDEAVEQLRKAVQELKPLRPDYVSMTYGAGGSTRERTLESIRDIRNQEGIEAMPHLTCAGQTASEIAGVLDWIAEAGIGNVLALRGDPPRGQTDFVPTEGGFAHANELAEFIHTRWDFCLGGAWYPEGHLESANLDEDIAHTKLKVESGISFLNSQLFFEASDYFEWVKRARAAGIAAPLVPGILPVFSAGQVSAKGFIARCGATIPEALRERFDAADSDDARITEIAIDWATEQCITLLEGGVPGIHFYPLNRSYSTVQIFERLKARVPDFMAR